MTGGLVTLSTKNSLLWIAYFIVYIGGFASLMFLTRASSFSWTGPVLAVAFPVILVSIGAMAGRTEVDEESGSHRR